MNSSKEIKHTRTDNTIRNIGAGFINRGIVLLLPFIVRTVLIKKLGADYVGIGSLFTSILQVLNVTELGFSSAIICSLYEPVAKNNLDEIRKKIGLFRTVYKLVGIVILLFGIIITPFLQYLIKGTIPKGTNIYIAFWIYLINTIISYLTFGYKNSILTVYQRNDLISRTNTIVNIIKCTAQIVVLYLCSDFYVYIIVIPITTLLGDVIINCISNRIYPELNVKYKLSLSGLDEMKEQIEGIAIGRVSLACRNSFDNIIVSSFYGLILTAVYSNYYFVFISVGSLFSILITSMIASIGNSLVTESIEKNRSDHIKYDFFYEFFVGVCAICMCTLYQPFMKIWVGKKLMLPFVSMVLFCIYFYINQLSQVRSAYSEAAGLWWHFRYLAITEMIANLILNIVLGKVIGINGILIATIITAFGCSFLGCTIITYKKLFKTSCKEYFIRNIFYFLTTVAGCFIVRYITSGIVVSGWKTLALKSFVCACLSVGYLVAVYIMYKPTKNNIKSLFIVIQHVLLKK